MQDGQTLFASLKGKTWGESSSEKKKEIFYISRNIFTIEIDYYFLGIENDEKLMFMISIVLILRM